MTVERKGAATRSKQSSSIKEWVKLLGALVVPYTCDGRAVGCAGDGVGERTMGQIGDITRNGKWKRQGTSRARMVNHTVRLWQFDAVGVGRKAPLGRLRGRECWAGALAWDFMAGGVYVVFHFKPWRGLGDC